MASTVDSRKPASFSVSVWMATCTPDSSATRRQASIAAGVLPQSSCSFNPPAPARSCSQSAPALVVLPFPIRSTLIGRWSIACSMRPIARGPGVTVVALVPSAGPGPPPARGLGPPGGAGPPAGGGRGARGGGGVDQPGGDEVDVTVDPPRREDLPVPGDHL